MITQKTFRGNATELCELIKDFFQEELFPNRITRDLLQHTFELEQYGVSVRTMRSNGQRLIVLDYNLESDSSDGKILVPEELKVTAPADPVSEENLLTEPKDDSDGKTETEETEKVTDPVEVVTVPCSSIVQFAADMMYNRMKEQGIPIKPFDENTAV